MSTHNIRGGAHDKKQALALNAEVWLVGRRGHRRRGEPHRRIIESPKAKCVVAVYAQGFINSCMHRIIAEWGSVGGYVGG